MPKVWTRPLRNKLNDVYYDLLYLSQIFSLWHFTTWHAQTLREVPEHVFRTSQEACFTILTTAKYENHPAVKTVSVSKSIRYSNWWFDTSYGRFPNIKFPLNKKRLWFIEYYPGLYLCKKYKNIPWKVLNQLFSLGVQVWTEVINNFPLLEPKVHNLWTITDFMRRRC